MKKNTDQSLNAPPTPEQSTVPTKTDVDGISQTTTSPKLVETENTPKNISKRAFQIIALVLVAFLFIVIIYNIYKKTQPKIQNSVESVVTPTTGLTGNSIIPVDFLEGKELSAFTEFHRGSLDAGESVSISLPIDNDGAGMFYLGWWSENKPDFTLTQPDGKLIDEIYTNRDPGMEFEYFAGGADVPPHSAYSISSIQPGIWKLNIKAFGELDYQAFAMLESNLILTSETDSSSYSIEDVAQITANLSSNNVNLEDVVITATFHRSDSIIDTVALTDQGNGIYKNTYTIPNSSGFLSLEVSATGKYNDKPFSRQNPHILTVKSEDVKFTGKYSEKPVDKNKNGLYEYIDFSFEIESKVSGSFIIMADLYSDGQYVTDNADPFDLEPGRQTMTLPFSGKEIIKSKLNGPYSITRLVLIPTDTGISADPVDNVFTTASYKYTQFESEN